MEFKYMFEQIATGVIDIDDISCCCIEGFNDLGQVFYLLTKTECGFTKILTFGPVLPEFPGIMPAKYDVSFQRIEYNAGKVSKAISTFLQNPKSQITQAIVQDPEVAMQQFLTATDYYREGGF